MDDLISRRKAFEYFVTLWECIGTIMDRDEWEDVCMTTANEIPLAQPEKRTEERTETHACDLIDRQAAINALWKALYEYEDKTEKQFIESDELDVTDWIHHRIFVQNMSDIDRQTILNLPSVQPQRKTDEWCTDCKEYDQEKHCCPRWNRVIRQTLSEQPEIIRCKDCKHWRDDHTCREHSLVSPMTANEFCSRAERRTDGSD